MKLKEVLQDRELFQAYPELQDLKIQADPLGEDILGTYKKDKKKIYFNENGEEVSLKEATYTALIQETKQKMIVTIMCHNKTIYTLEYQHYQQRKF